MWCKGTLLRLSCCEFGVWSVERYCVSITPRHSITPCFHNKLASHIQRQPPGLVPCHTPLRNSRKEARSKTVQAQNNRCFLHPFDPNEQQHQSSRYRGNFSPLCGARYLQEVVYSNPIWDGHMVSSTSRRRKQWHKDRARRSGKAGFRGQTLTMEGGLGGVLGYFSAIKQLPYRFRRRET